MTTGFALRFEHRKWNRGRNGLHQFGQPVAPLFCFLCSNLKANPVTLFRSKVLPVNTYTRYSCTLSNFRLVHAFYRRDEPCTLHRLRLRPHLPLHHSAGALEPARGGADGGRLGGTGAQRRQRQRHRRLLSRPRIGALWASRGGPQTLGEPQPRRKVIGLGFIIYVRIPNKCEFHATKLIYNFH